MGAATSRYDGFLLLLLPPLLLQLPFFRGIVSCLWNVSVLRRLPVAACRRRLTPPACTDSACCRARHGACRAAARPTTATGARTTLATATCRWGAAAAVWLSGRKGAGGGQVWGGTVQYHTTFLTLPHHTPPRSPCPAPAGEHWDQTEQMDTYYNPIPHFGYDLALAHSPQLRSVPMLPRDQQGDLGLGGAATLL